MDAKMCLICNQEFDYKSGKFTIHLMERHNLSLREYILSYEFKETLVCKCGFCNEIPEFYRGKFLEYKSGHKNFKWLKEKWIEKYGNPICPTCGKNIEKWFRGKPNKFCCLGCKTNNWNQEKINKTIGEKYGVENIFQLEEIKEKIIETNNRKYGKDYYTQTNDFKNIIKSKDYSQNIIKMRMSKKEKYGDEYYYDKMKFKETCLKNNGVEHPSQLQKNRINSTKRMLKNNPMFNKETSKKVSLSNIENLKNGKIGYKTKRYKNTELYYQSSYEFDFLELCEKLSIINDIKNGNSYIYENNDFGCWMLTDFSIGNYEIEIKSNYILEKQGGLNILNLKRNTVEKTGKKYILILDKNYEEFLFFFNI